MNAVILHPDRDFLNPRNPSSPFQFKSQMEQNVWQYIEENAFVSTGAAEIDINGIRYWANSKAELFEFIKSNWGI